MQHIPGGPYEVITSVAAIHHMPFEAALIRLRERLASAGTLVIVGLYRERTITDRLIALVAVVANMAMGWIKNKGHRAALQPVMRPESDRQP